jgi:hypothetical protein
MLSWCNLRSNFIPQKARFPSAYLNRLFDVIGAASVEIK